MPAMGHKSWLQVAKETFYGTAVAATQRLELIKWSVSQTISSIKDPSLYSGQSVRGVYQGGQNVKGTFTVRCGYEGLEEIMRGCMGTYANTKSQIGGTITITGVSLVIAADSLLTYSANTNIYVGAAVSYTVGNGTGSLSAGCYVTQVIDSTHCRVNGINTVGAGGTTSSLVFTNNVHDHLATDGPVLNSYTLEASEGDSPSLLNIAGSSITTTALTLGTAAPSTLAVGTRIYGVGVQAGTTIVSGSGTSYVITPSHAVATGTIVVSIDTSGNCARVVGAVFTGFTIKGTSGTGNDAMLTIDVTVLGKDMTKGNAPSRYQAVTGATISATNVISAFSAPTDPIIVGQTVTGPGIPGGTTVTAVNAANNVTLSQACTNASGLALQFSLSYPALLPVLYHQSYIMQDGTTDTTQIRWRSFEVSVAAPHTEDRYYLGSVNMDQPLRQDFITTKWKAVQEFNSLSQFNAAKNFLPTAGMKLVFRNPNVLNAAPPTSSSSIAALTLTWGSGTSAPIGCVLTGTNVLAGTYITSVTNTTTATVNQPQTVASTAITATAYRELELRSNSFRFTSFSNPVENYGVILSTSEAEAIIDPTDLSGLVVRIRNVIPTLA